jgi:ribosomal protein S18 acetylase RimI-like enzyme
LPRGPLDGLIATACGGRRPNETVKTVKTVELRGERHVIEVRPPRLEDSADFGSLHVRAWQRAYRGGLMPDAYLDALSIEERSQMWREALQRPFRPRFSLFVAEDEKGSVVGYINVGPAGGDVDTETGEIFAINVDPDAWGRGYGSALLEAGVRDLAASGFATAVLWVHPHNGRARSFYERAGWRADGHERREEILGVETPEVRYGTSVQRDH